MPIQQDQLNPTTTSITFEDFHNDDSATRVLHNGSDFIKCDFDDDPANPIIRYYRTNGDKAAAYATEKDNILDLAYDNFNDKYYTVRNYIDSQDVLVSSGIDFTTTTGADYSFDNFDDTNVAFYIASDNLFFRNAVGYESKLISKRVLGSPFEDQTIALQAESTPIATISGAFSASIDYNLPLASISGTERSALSMTVRDTFNNNDRYTVGVASSGTGDSDTVHFRASLDNTEDVSSPNLVRFGSISLNPEAMMALATSGTTGFTVTVTNTVSGAHNQLWDVVTPVTSPSGVTTDFSGSQGYIDSVLSFGLVRSVNPVNSGVDGESISFDVDLEFTYVPATPTGTLNIARTSGTTPTYSSSLSASYDQAYTIFDFLANETMNLYLTTHNEQFDLVAAELDNFTITSGSVPPPVIAAQAIITTVTDTTTYSMLDVDQVDAQGNVVNDLLNRIGVFDPLVERETVVEIVGSGTIITNETISGTQGTDNIALAVNQASEGYLLFDGAEVYTVDLNPGTYTATGVIDSTTSGIVVSSGITADALDFTFNPNTGGFLQYQAFAAGERLLRTLDISSSGTISASNREVFLNQPTSFVTGDHFFLHGVDPNTLFHFRRNGLNINVKKVDSNGTVAGSVLNDSTADFVIAGVQTGDKVYIASLDETHTVGEVLDSNNLTLPDTSPGDGAYAYKLYAGTEQIQYNVDTSLSAFASVNVDDFSLGAGTSETSNVTAEVINAWGDPLQGKSVSFIVSNGDGAVAPPSDSTDVNGAATTVYTVGVTPGPVIVTATVSD